MALRAQASEPMLLQEGTVQLAKARRIDSAHTLSTASGTPRGSSAYLSDSPDPPWLASTDAKSSPSPAPSSDDASRERGPAPVATVPKPHGFRAEHSGGHSAGTSEILTKGSFKDSHTASGVDGCKLPVRFFCAIQ